MRRNHWIASSESATDGALKSEELFLSCSKKIILHKQKIQDVFFAAVITGLRTVELAAKFLAHNPLTRVDQWGLKELPFYEYFREAIRNTATPLFNCHSFAFRGWMGNPSDPRNEYPISQGATRWHNNPDKDLENYIALDPDADSLVGDRVIYFDDLNEDGQWSEGEKIYHSAIVNKVDDSGNVLTIIQKDGPNAIVVSSPIHSNYEEPVDLMGNYVITTRAYFRKVETEEPSDVE